jgi:hypothetical protein
MWCRHRPIGRNWPISPPSLGAEFAEQESVGRHMSAAALLRAAADAI